MKNMYTEDGDEIQREAGAVATNFTMIPNFILSLPEMTGNAMHLYHWYIYASGQNNRCWQSLDTIAKHCRMSRNTIISCRDILLQAGLITVTPHKCANGYTQHIITIRNVWVRAAEWEGAFVNKSPVQNLTEVDKSPVQILTKPSSDSDKAQFKNSQSPVQKLNSTNTTTKNTNKSKIEKEKELSAVADAAIPPLDESLLFGKDEVVPKKETRFTRSARELYQCLSQKRKIFREVNLDKWAAVFRSFMVETDITSEEFDETLAWYIDHAGEEFVPQAYSAGSFVEKFAKIRDQMLLGRNRLRGSSGRISVSEQNEESARIVKERIRNGTFGTRFEN